MATATNIPQQLKVEELAPVPQGQSSPVVLYSAEPIEAVIDGAPVGPKGRLYSLSAGKPVRVPYEVARFFLEHLAYAGVVRVRETETETGVEYDVQGAKDAAAALLAESDEVRFRNYVAATVTDFVARNRPVPPPAEPILRIIERRGYDLKRFGIVPIGWEEPEKDKRVGQLEDENRALKQALADLTTKVDSLTGGQRETMRPKGRAAR